jgi:DHA3 family macrolide efflux protein-like MFS transporter
MKSKWNKNIIQFLFGQSISLFGTQLVQYVIMWYITLETQSGFMMTISIIVGFLPTFILSPFTGVMADRVSRRKLIIFSDGMIAAVTLILAILFSLGYGSIWLLFFMSAIRAVGTSIQNPAVNAFVPQLVDEKMLMKVNGVNQSIQSVITIISPMVAGGLMTFAKVELIFLVDVVTAIIAIGILLLMKIPAHHKAIEKQTIGYFADLKNGFIYISQHSYLKIFFVFLAVFVFLFSPYGFLAPLQVVRNFGDDVWRLTFFEVSFALGMVSGGLLMSTWGGFRNRVHTFIFSAFMVGALIISLGIVKIFWLYIALAGLTGITMPLFHTPMTVLLQEKVEEDYLGRVFGVLSMIMNAIMPFAMLVFGPIADIVSIDWILVGTGIALLGLAVVLANNKAMIAAGEPKLHTDRL